MDKIIYQLQQLKLKQELPNDDTFQFNMGYVKAIIDCIKIIKESNNDELMIEFGDLCRKTWYKDGFYTKDLLKRFYENKKTG